MKPIASRLRVPQALIAAAFLLTPTGALAAGDGFLFSQPRFAFTVRGGVDRPIAGGDVFAFVTDELTVSRGDFTGGALAADLSFPLSQKTSLVLAISGGGTSAPSEFRHWLDNDNRPIEQTTEFDRVPVTASLKMYLRPPGRAIGRFAWIPARHAPYAGVGGGAMYYNFRQSGDFVDAVTSRVFADTFTSEGWTPVAHVFAGTDVTLTPRIALSVEGKYQWARASLGADFRGFDRLDLSGFSMTTGLSFRY
jgi:hypothetical protein